MLYLPRWKAGISSRLVPLQMDGADPEKDTGVLLNSSREQLIDMGTKLFLYFLHDDVAQKFRGCLLSSSTKPHSFRTVCGAIY